MREIKNKRMQAIAKIEACILSCETKEQLGTCLTLVRSFNKKYDNLPGYAYLSGLLNGAYSKFDESPHYFKEYL